MAAVRASIPGWPFKLTITLIVVAASLSGCATPKTAMPPAASMTPSTAPTASHPLVEGGLTIKPGTAWPFMDEAGQRFLFVVTNLNGETMTVDVDSPAEAFADARSNNPFIGNLTLGYVADYGGSPLPLLPPASQLTWQTRWGQEERTHTATKDASGRTLVVVSTAAGPVASYTFDPAVAWFTSISFEQPDGKPAHVLTMSGQPTQGTQGVRYSLEVEMSYHKQGFNTGDAVVFTALPGATDFWIGGKLACGQPGIYSVTLQMVGGTDPTIKQSGLCDAMGHDMPGTVVAPIPAGRYVVEAYANSADSKTDIDAYVRTAQTVMVR